MSDDRPTREQMANTHDPRGCHFCMDERHGDQAPDPLELENDRLRSEVERLRELTKRVFVGPCIHGRDPYERCDSDDVPPGVVPCGELEWWEAHARAIGSQVATLTAERDAARRQLEDLAYSHSLCGDLRDECINAETEACAKVLDKLAAEFRAKTGPHHDVDTGDGLAAEIDRAIRARGAK